MDKNYEVLCVSQVSCLIVVVVCPFELYRRCWLKTNCCNVFKLCFLSLHFTLNVPTLLIHLTSVGSCLLSFVTIITAYYLQFTLCYILKGNKPDFHQAMAAEQSQLLYNSFLDQMKAAYSADYVKGGSLCNLGVISLFIFRLFVLKV